MIPLNTSVSATLDSEGTATAELSPSVFGTVWHIHRLVTSVAGTAERVRLRVYRNVTQMSALIDSTQSARDDVSETSIVLTASEKLIFVWSSTPNAVGAACVINVYGDSDTGRR